MNLELSILTILGLSDGLLIPSSTLVAELRLRDRRETLTEIHATLGRLEAAGEVIGITNRDTGIKWRIADPGRARLVAAGL